MYSEHWYVSPSWDPEFKKYQILAIDSFLQDRMRHKEWFPYYSHINSAKDYLKDILYARDKFLTKDLRGGDLERERLLYAVTNEEDNNLLSDDIWQILKQSFSAVSSWYDQLNIAVENVIDAVRFSEIGIHSNFFGSGTVFVPYGSGLTYSFQYTYHSFSKEMSSEFGYLVFTDRDEIRHSSLKTWESIKLEWMEQTNKDNLNGVILAEGLNELPLENAAMPILQMELPKWLKRKGG